MSEANCGRVGSARRGSSPDNSENRAAAALAQLTGEQRLVCVWKKAGFSDAEIQAWLKAAGLASEQPIHLSGRPLTVGIWIGRRPAEPQALRRPRSTPANDPARAAFGGPR